MVCGRWPSHATGVIVVDTSAAIDALVARPTEPELARRLIDDGDLQAPHLIDVEFLQVLRRLVAAGELTEERAADTRLDFDDLTLTRYPHHSLADRMWDLRQNLTAYDAAFVALAEGLGVPLLTTDGRVANAAGHRAIVEVR